MVRLRPFYTLLLTILFPIFAFAENRLGATIQGKVLDDKGQPALTAVVQLLKAADSSFVKGDMANEKGQFQFLNTQAGRYFLKVSRVDLETHYSSPFTLEGQDLNLEDIRMTAATKSLKEVEITARRPLIQRMEDRLVFNVSELTTGTGSNALELLRKAPGVVLDRDNTLILKGRTGVRVQINGKQSPLSVADLAAYLESIPAGDIEAIEIIENPSSKYDAAGSAGIINIRFKKNKNLGTNGTINGGVNVGKMYPKYNGGIQLNHRGKKVNVFGGYSDNTGRFWNFNNFVRTQNGTVYDQKSEDRSTRQNHNYRAGADLMITSKHTVGVLATGGYSENDKITSSFTRILDDSTQNWYQNLNARNEIKTYRKNLNTNLNYQFKDTSGHQLNVDFDYGIFDNSMRSFQPNTYETVEGVLVRQTDYANHSPTQITIQTAKADYEQRLLGGKLGLGAKATQIKTDNTFEFFDIVNGIETKNLNRSNRFVYTENVNAAYLNYSRTLGKKINFQAGVRGEQTNSRGELTSAVPQNDQNVTRHYFNLFPSASINYQQSQKSSWGLSYSRRITRPNYQDLNPFEYKLDELSYMKGNAFLQPMYTNSLSISNTLFSMVNQSISFAQTNNFFAQITDTTERTRAFLTQKNIATEKVWSYNVSSPFQITRWWSGFGNLGVNYSRYRANFGEGKVVNLNVTTFNTYMQHTFKLRKSLTLEISGFYNSPSVWGGTFKTRRIYNVDAGIRQKLLGDAATVSFTVTDIFYGQPWKGVNNFGGLKIVGNGGWESRQVRVGFTYNFGNQQVKKARNRTLGAESELNRISR